jgi:hypothetical protein
MNPSFFIPVVRFKVEMAERLRKVKKVVEKKEKETGNGEKTRVSKKSPHGRQWVVGGKKRKPTKLKVQQ